MTQTLRPEPAMVSPESVEKARHARVCFRFVARPYRFVKEGGEHGQDREGPAPEEPPQHHGLELDRVLAPMGRLGGEQIVTVAALERIEEIAIDLRGSQRRVVGLERHGEGIRHARVAGAEDDEEVRVGALEQRAVGPRIGRPASMEVDVRRDEPAKARGLRARRHGKPRPVGVREEPVDLAFRRASALPA